MKMNKSVLDFANDHIDKIILTILLSTFVVFSAFFAIKLKTGIIPDETHHFLVSKLFSTTWGIPTDTSETIQFGVIKNKPFLFYWINARILNLFNWIIPAISERKVLTFFRLLGVIYSTITVIFGYLFAKEIIKNNWGQLFVVFLMTNTLMFVFLSGGHSYDNMLNLCSFAGIYYLTCVFNGKSFYKNSLLWLISILLGSLIKITIFPLAIITTLLWLVYTIKNRQAINFRFIWNIKTISISLICAALFATNLVIYGGSVMKYHTLTPDCAQVLTKKQCLDYDYPQYVRDQNLRLEEKVSVTDIVRGEYPDPFEYGFDHWPSLMLKRIYGILGHQSYFPEESITVHRLLILWTLFVTIKYWEKPSLAIKNSYIILFFYTLILFLDNYNTELVFGFKHVGIQGRYFFPVIGIYYTMMVYYFCEIPNNILRMATFEIAAILFLYGGPAVFLLRFYNSGLLDWFR